ncbi:MAG: hypothetical protein A2W33_04345 [Chloroflexi bacterium RBG_16_52_11]|nr:MAG: hypothetical protein A2W33_04345 [Chloroflexi bacterium RBG_16_52_11]
MRRVYEENRLWQTTYWRGWRCQKMPQDLWQLADVITEVGPDVIIETGTADGGSSFFMADVCELLGHGEVHSIDIKASTSTLKHPRLEHWVGSSIDDGIVESIRKHTEGKSVLVNLDSAHDKAHVLREMELYGPMVSINSFMVVEDTNLNGHPVRCDYGPGPWEAVEAFLYTHPEFRPDERRERYGTFSPGGWLRKTQ